MVETYAGWKRGIINRLISFDIDGTLEIGDPPGLIPLDAVRRAIALGFVVGSCSDRPLQIQRALWRRHGLRMHFSVLKQHLESVREAFSASRYLHIGDSPVDRWMASDAGFDFIHVERTDLEDGAMTRGGSYPAEIRERAVRMVFEHEVEHPSQWATITSIASKFGMTPETLRAWVRRAEVHAGLSELRNLGLLD